MNIKIISIDLEHGNEYSVVGLKEIISVDFHQTKHKRKALLICEMER